jgi:hypothetical protein
MEAAPVPLLPSLVIAWNLPLLSLLVVGHHIVGVVWAALVSVGSDRRVVLWCGRCRLCRSRTDLRQWSRVWPILAPVPPPISVAASPASLVCASESALVYVGPPSPRHVATPSMVVVGLTTLVRTDAPGSPSFPTSLPFVAASDGFTIRQ